MAKKVYDKLETYEDLPITSMTFKPVSEVSKTGEWRTYRPIIDVEKCINCLICWKFCPEPCVIMGEEAPTIDYDYCKGCGICANECPKDAIVLILEVEAQAEDEKKKKEAGGN
jgi:2-oxoacid:acceptor oxidoreductase delta subunit (pyruvate/2-ketoisovalerate family)